MPLTRERTLCSFEPGWKVRKKDWMKVALEHHRMRAVARPIRSAAEVRWYRGTFRP